MLRPFLHFSVAALLSIGLSAESHAQYMYLDVNGDGVNDSQDRLNPVSIPTVVDVYLATDRNALGLISVCTIEPTTGLNVFSYVVNLQATGGVVNYLGFVNRVSGPEGY